MRLRHQEDHFETKLDTFSAKDSAKNHKEFLKLSLNSRNSEKTQAARDAKKRWRYVESKFLKCKKSAKLFLGNKIEFKKLHFSGDFAANILNFLNLSRDYCII